MLLSVCTRGPKRSRERKRYVLRGTRTSSCVCYTTGINRTPPRWDRPIEERDQGREIHIHASERFQPTEFNGERNQGVNPCRKEIRSYPIPVREREIHPIRSTRPRGTPNASVLTNIAIVPLDRAHKSLLSSKSSPPSTSKHTSQRNESRQKEALMELRERIPRPERAGRAIVHRNKARV